MYSEKNIFKMIFTLNCLFLGEASARSIPVVISEETIVGNSSIEYKEIAVSHVKTLILSGKGMGDYPLDKLDLWKVDQVSVDNNKNALVTFSTEDDIKGKLGGELMEPRSFLDEYFNKNSFKDRKSKSAIHIIVQLLTPTTAGPPQQGVSQDVVDWTNIDSIYDWIKPLKRPLEAVAPKLVGGTSGANFPLQGREETMKILMEGNGSRNGIYKRFTKRSELDRNNHPIPLLANGPGTGKSRFLQEIPTLLREQAEKYTSNNELLKMINNQMYTINVTFGNGTSASVEDVPIGETSVSLRILYEHFISGGSYTLEDFRMMCLRNGIGNFSINQALNVVLKDVNSDKDKDSHIKFVVLGIDELNALHNLYDKNLDRRLGPVYLIMRAVGGLNCTGGDMFYMSILAGTIQGPFEELFKESTYLYLHLPLRLLRDKEVWNISEYVAHSERNHNLEDYINKGTFRRCISDFGGHVRALDLFYEELLNKVINRTDEVNYIDVMLSVREELGRRYPFMEFSTITPALARAILNIPVNEEDKVGNLTYVDLSSQGILNLESASNNLYVRMPYVWVWILTSYNQSRKFWDVMIDQKSHILWQSFEDFNMRFWALRLRLLSTLNINVTIQELFRGAHYLYDFSFLEDEHNFVLPDADSINFHELSYQYPYTVQQEHLLSGIIYKNGLNAPWDIFFFLGNCLFAIQVKSSDPQTNQPQTLSKKMVADEYAKSEAGFKVLNKKIPVIRDWMLFICTNGCKTKDALDELPQNCLAVYNENFKDFYGYTFSSRAEFCAANDKLDANTAKEFELRTIDSVGPVTAREICNKRPYNDEDHLYKQVKLGGRAKKRINVIKNVN